jgi:solute carrier family 35 protein F1/2
MLLDAYVLPSSLTTAHRTPVAHSWAIPVCLFFSWVFMRVRYQRTQLLGILVCVAGLGMLVASDHLTDKDYPALDMAKGDVFMIVGASLCVLSPFLLDGTAGC